MGEVIVGPGFRYPDFPVWRFCRFLLIAVQDDKCLSSNRKVKNAVFQTSCRCTQFPDLAAQMPAVRHSQGGAEYGQQADGLSNPRLMLDPQTSEPIFDGHASPGIVVEFDAPRRIDHCSVLYQLWYNCQYKKRLRSAVR
jgi:hypothetical protein